MKKNLIMCLLPDDEHSKNMSEALVQNNNKSAKEVKIIRTFIEILKICLLR